MAAGSSYFFGLLHRLVAVERRELRVGAVAEGDEAQLAQSCSWKSVMITSVEHFVATPGLSVANEWTGRPVTSPPSSRQTLPRAVDALADAADAGQPARLGEGTGSARPRRRRPRCPRDSRSGPGRPRPRGSGTVASRPPSSS